MVGLRAGALPLLDHPGEARVEGGVVAVARLVVRLAAVDLEGEAVAARGVVGPVLRRARRVVELVGVLAEVAVVQRHVVTEVLVAAVLVDRLAERGDARARGTRPAVVWFVISVTTWLRETSAWMFFVSGSRERAGAAVGLGEHVRGVGARPAPQAAVVAVRVHTVLEQARRGEAVAGVGVVGEPAVLAAVLAAGGAARHQVDQVAHGLVAAAVGADARRARGVEAVRVHDRDDDVAAVLHDLDGAGSPAL